LLAVFRVFRQIVSAGFLSGLRPRLIAVAKSAQID
jgi:hypothetical protein